MTQTIKIADIMKILPHTFPFLLIDRIIDYKACGEQSFIRGMKNVSINEHYFHGHFSRNPIMPNTLVLEGLVQITAILMHKMLLHENVKHEKMSFFAGTNKLRFRKNAIPGDTIIYKSRFLPSNGVPRLFNATATINKNTVAVATLLFLVQS